MQRRLRPRQDGRCVAPINPERGCKRRAGAGTASAASPGRSLQGERLGVERQAQTCSPPTSPADECKTKGWIWDGKRCLDPADACKAKGGKWDGNSCQHKANPAEECRNKGGVWNGRSCQSPADLCKAKGGVWDGNSCSTNPTLPRNAARGAVCGMAKAARARPTSARPRAGTGTARTASDRQPASSRGPSSRGDLPLGNNEGRPRLGRPFRFRGNLLRRCRFCHDYD